MADLSNEHVMLTAAYDELARAYKERDRYREALELLAKPAAMPKTEEAALLQMEVEQIAREALAPRDGEDED